MLARLRPLPPGCLRLARSSPGRSPAGRLRWPGAPGSLSASAARLAFSWVVPLPEAMSFSSWASSLSASVPPRWSTIRFALFMRSFRRMVNSYLVGFSEDGTNPHQSRIKIPNT